ncbi:hypothetical protein JI664_12905 [Rhodobacter sp. NTK016B]|uniref:hypothetical protein n=1 Tax=Rhodobacter sp. NTK016B TaxID=2759676 RepID=UPI001A8EFBFF|nr:hypothetical protein [Rhodobacter sp. NTK016B]MBN8292867.1 hypothetical protein [Rhodobacter sp. NTK016B]
MTEAPREIWATVNGVRTTMPGKCTVEIGGWEAAPKGSPREVRYIRADLVQELIEALTECTEITHKAYVSATMEAVNAGPHHPVAKQMDVWRARCMRAEEMARAALRKIGAARASITKEGLDDG